MGTTPSLWQDDGGARPSDLKEESFTKAKDVLPQERKGAISRRSAESWVVGSHVGHHESQDGRPVLRQEAL